MEYEWDEAKNTENIRKHRIDFADAVSIFNGATLERIDDRFDYGETRILTTGLLFGVSCIVVTHTDRDKRVRIISARKATKKERDAYDELEA